MRSWKTLVAGALAIMATSVPAQRVDRLAPSLAPREMARAAPAAPIATPMSPTGPHVLGKADVDAWLDGYMPYALRTGDIAGAVVVVVKDGQVLTQRGFGYADVAKRRPVDPDTTLFRPGSVSKLVTWTAVMQLVEQGKIDLDADVNRYLDFRIPPRDGQPITMRQIMTHTAGFEDVAKNLIALDRKNHVPLEPYLKTWVPHRIYAAGTTPAYSNWATALAGYVVQRVSGQSFDDYVDRNVFTPLGMRNSTFRQPLPARLQPMMATGYPRASAPASPYEYVNPAPAGSLASTGADMARFMIAHLQDGTIDGHAILRPETARVMHQSPLDKVNPKSLIPPLNRMELGFFETNINGREVVGHLGDTQVFHTALHLFLADKVGLYLSVNSAGKAGAAGAVRAALFSDFADRYFPATGQDGRIDAKTSADHARMMAGNWQVSRRLKNGFVRALSLMSQTKVLVGPKGELVIPDLKGPSGGPRRWTEIAPFVWREVGGHDRVAAQVVDGKVVRWSMDMESPFAVFDRVPASVSNTWLLPLLYVSLAVLLLAFLHWPAAALVRRRYKAPLAAAGRARWMYRGVRLAAGLDLAMLIAWAIAITVLFGDLAKLNSGADLLLWVLQIVGLIVFVGAVVVAALNVAAALRDRRRWPGKLWAVLVLVATVTVLYVAFAFGLLDMTVNY